MSEDFSFEEFAAMRRRRSAQSTNGNTAAAADKDTGTVGNAAKDANGKKDKGNVLERLGVMLQSQELQLVMMILIGFDFLSGFYQLYSSVKGWSSPFLDILVYQSGLSLLLFSLELFLVVVAFREQVLSQAGYTLDLVLVGIMFYFTVMNSPSSQVNGNGEAVYAARLLNALRFWRAFRLVEQAMHQQDEQHAETRRQLAEAKDRVEGLRVRAKKAEISVKREVDKYRRLEQNFRVQRDELDTMREALQIAAQTMAKVQGLGSIAELMEQEDTFEFEKEVDEEEKAHRNQHHHQHQQDDLNDDSGSDMGDSEFEDPVSDGEGLIADTQRSSMGVELAIGAALPQEA